LVSENSSTMARIGTSYSKFNVMKFDGSSNFGLWQRHVNDLLVQQGMMKVFYRTRWDVGHRLEGTLG
jgi:hypothetical protein